jgi:hypothetical protein
VSFPNAYRRRISGKSSRDDLATATPVEGLKKRYADIAACYRLLAKEREWLIGTGTIDGEEAGLSSPPGPTKP